MLPEDKNRIEDLKQSLYSRNAPDIKSHRKLRVTDDAPEVPHDWGSPAQEKPTLEEMLAQAEPKKGLHFPGKFLIGSAIFCLLAVAAGAFLFFKGSNFISGNNIAIEVSGPVSVPGGTPVTFGITVTNRNSVALKTADLDISFPAGATDPADTTKSLENHREILGDIPPGGSVTRNVQAVIFGEQNTQKKIIARVTYGIVGSNSVFTKESSYDVIVNASPVSVSIDSLEEVISGQEFELKMDIKSNTANPVKNVILKTAYPFGFTFKSASVQPINTDNTVWSIGDIPPGVVWTAYI